MVLPESWATCRPEICDQDFSKIARFFISSAVLLEVGVGVGVGVGVVVGVDADAGVGVGVGLSTRTLIPLLQTNFLPDLMQVYFIPATTDVWFNLVQVVPALTAAEAGLSKKVPNKAITVEAITPLRITGVYVQKIQIGMIWVPNVSEQGDSLTTQFLLNII